MHDGTYKPFKKVNDNSKYLHRDSDHPIKIIESVPKTVAHRINMLCSNNEIFTDVKREYEKELKSQGYKYLTLAFKPVENMEERKARLETKKIKSKSAREIQWFVPPFTKQVDGRTSVGKKFFAIMDSCFPKTHPL